MFDPLFILLFILYLIIQFYSVFSFYNIILCCFTRGKKNHCNAEFFARINTIVSRYILLSFFIYTHEFAHSEKHVFHSQLIRDSQENIANGLTVFNPLLVGAVSSSLIPNVYGPFDSFSILLMILATIFRQV